MRQDTHQGRFLQGNTVCFLCTSVSYAERGGRLNSPIAPGPIGNRWWSGIVDPVVKLWRHDRLNLSIFALANLIFGQAGILIAFLFFLQSGIAFGPFWNETISSGALYTFAIALTASVLASNAFEFIDGQRTGNRVLLYQPKLVWSTIAAVLVICQAALVGGLLSSSNEQEAPPSSTAAPGTVTQAASTISAQSQIPATAPSQLPPPSPPSLQQVAKPVRPWLQVLLWVVSMFVALQLFCISRLPFIRDSYAKERSEDVESLTANAETISTTPFGEQL